VTRFALGRTDTWIEVGLVQRIALRRSWTVELETTWSEIGGQSWERVAGQVKLFF